MAQPMTTEEAQWIPEEKFGDRLHLLRERLGVASADDIARECDISASTWRSWEAGRYPRNIDKIVGKIVAGVRASYGKELDPAWLAGLYVNDPSKWGRASRWMIDAAGQSSFSDGDESPTVHLAASHPQQRLPFRLPSVRRDRSFSVIGDE